MKPQAIHKDVSGSAALKTGGGKKKALSRPFFIRKVLCNTMIHKAQQKKMALLFRSTEMSS